MSLPPEGGLDLPAPPPAPDGPPEPTDPYDLRPDGLDPEGDAAAWA